MKYSANDELYEGMWENGNRHGNGKQTSADGTVLEGEFREGKTYNGNGTLAMTDGTWFEGTWVEGKISDNGDVSVKKRKENAPHGYGKMLFSDGVVYEGMWVNGERHGAGKLVNIDGVVVDGEFRHNKLYSGSGKKVITPSGNICEATWVKGKMKGTLTSPTGQVLEGSCRREKVYSKNLRKAKFLKPTLFAKLTKEECATLCEKHGWVLGWKSRDLLLKAGVAYRLGKDSDH